MLIKCLTRSDYYIQLQENDVAQEELFAMHRRTLQHLVQQAALHGGEALAPPQVVAGIEHARGEVDARFLDYCTERIFLRKVGGGYIFVHHMLMEYFAGLPESVTAVPRGAKAPYSTRSVPEE